MLIECSLGSCDSSKTEFNIARCAIQILYNAGSINPFEDSPYIPSLDLTQKMFRNKILRWGGFASLLYIDRNTTSKPIKEFCKDLKLRSFFKGNKLLDVIKSIKTHLSVNAKNLTESKSFHDISSTNEPLISKSTFIFPRYYNTSLIEHCILLLI